MVLGLNLFGKKVNLKWTIKKGAWREKVGAGKDGWMGVVVCAKNDEGRELQNGDGGDFFPHDPCVTSARPFLYIYGTLAPNYM